MLTPRRVEEIFALRADGWSKRAIALHLGHDRRTIADYLAGRRTAGIRIDSRPDLFTDLFADYCRQRFAEDPHLLRSTLFAEATDLGFQGSRSTFYRGLARHLASVPGRPPAHPDARQELLALARKPTTGPLRNERALPRHEPVLPLPVTPVSGETLASYLARLADTNHLTLTELLVVLPSWFTTKINNRDDRAQHHMLAPATTQALDALAHLTHATPQSLAHALPAFGTSNRPVRATTACHRCTARRGIHQPVLVHLPAHHKACVRHGIWLSDSDQPQLDLTTCPEIVMAQRHANRLLRRHTLQQLMLTYQAAAKAIPAWPPAPTAIPIHWRHRLLTLQTANHHRGVPTDLDAYTHAATYPDAIARATELLRSSAL